MVKILPSRWQVKTGLVTGKPSVGTVNHANLTSDELPVNHEGGLEPENFTAYNIDEMEGLDLAAEREDEEQYRTPMVEELPNDESIKGQLRKWIHRHKPTSRLRVYVIINFH